VKSAGSYCAFVVAEKHKDARLVGLQCEETRQQKDAEGQEQQGQEDQPSVRLTSCLGTAFDRENEESDISQEKPD
jgi:hypothetical protein